MDSHIGLKKFNLPGDRLPEKPVRRLQEILKFLELSSGLMRILVG
jgi:hypothetical protein